jgi:hypothetical protein
MAHDLTWPTVADAQVFYGSGNDAVSIGTLVRQVMQHLAVSPRRIGLDAKFDS